MPNVRIAETCTGREERLFASGTGPPTGNRWSQSIRRCQETPDPHRPPSPEAGLAQPTSFFLATPFSRRFLEEVAFCLDNVLGLPSGLWELEMAAGGGRELGQSSLGVPSPLQASLTPSAGLRAQHTG